MALGDSRRAWIRSEMSEKHSFLRALAPARTSRSLLARAGSHTPRVNAHVAGIPKEGCGTLAVPTTASLRKLLRRGQLEKVKRIHRAMQLITALQHSEALETMPRLGAVIDVAPQDVEPHCGRAKPNEEVSSAPRMGERSGAERWTHCCCTPSCQAEEEGARRRRCRGTAARQRPCPTRAP